ncbi:MAG: hypothetical protein ACI8RZ_001260 [Myxococcota bacterium]
MLLTVAAAAAGGIAVLEDVRRIDPGVSGIWAIPVEVDGEWRLFWSKNRDLHHAPFDPTLGQLSAASQQLTEQGDLNDHAIRRCPDGTWLHLASTDTDNQLHRFSAGFQPLDSAVLGSGGVDRVRNDMQLVCGTAIQGALFAETDGERDWLLPIGEDLQTGTAVELLDSPRCTGAGVLLQDDRLLVVGRDAEPELVVSSYDPALRLLARDTVLIPDPDLRVQWPTGLVADGSGYLVLMIGQTIGEVWSADEGNLYLLRLSETLEVTGFQQLSAMSPPDGGMRPWLTLDEDQGVLVAGWDVEQNVELFVGHLTQPEGSTTDTGRQDTGGQDTGGQDTGGQDTDALPDTPAASGRMGCSGTKSLFMLPLFALSLLGVRRSQRKTDRIRPLATPCR